DLGTPEKYLLATFDALEGRIHGLTYDAPFIGEGAEVAGSARIGPRAVLGPGTVIGPDAEIQDSVLFSGTKVEARARVWGALWGNGARGGSDGTASGRVGARGGVVAPGPSAQDAKTPPYTVLEA